MYCIVRENLDRLQAEMHKKKGLYHGFVTQAKQLSQCMTQLSAETRQLRKDQREQLKSLNSEQKAELLVEYIKQLPLEQLQGIATTVAMLQDSQTAILAS